MPPVGRPPDQMSASIEPSFMPCTLSGRPSRACSTSSAVRSFTSSRRRAMTSVPEFGEPVETLLPARSAIEAMPASARTKTCVKLL